MGIKESIAPLSEKLQGLSLKVINPESKLERIKRVCQSDIELRIDSTNEFDAGSIYMASKILQIINE